MGVGYDRLDRAALAKKGITVCNVPDYGTEEIADHALGLVLALRRGILLHHDLQRAEPPAPYCPIDGPLVARSRGATFGILGLGRIGTAVALRAKAFGWYFVLFKSHSILFLTRYTLYAGTYSSTTLTCPTAPTSLSV